MFDDPRPFRVAAAGLCAGMLVISTVALIGKPQAVRPTTPAMTPTAQMPISTAVTAPLPQARPLSAQPTALPNLVDLREDAHRSIEAAVVVEEVTPQIRCDSDSVWFLPVRDAQFKISAGFGYHTADTPYFTLMKAHNLLADSTTEGVFHGGVDLRTGSNAPIFAVAAGQVLTVAYNDLIGKHVIMGVAPPTSSRQSLTQYSTRQVVYGHLNDIFVTAGQDVGCGQVLGISGATGKSIIGAHLHFEVREDGRAVDPMPLLKAAAQAQLPDVAQGHSVSASGMAFVGKP